MIKRMMNKPGILSQSGCCCNLIYRLPLEKINFYNDRKKAALKYGNLLTLRTILNKVITYVTNI